MQFLQSKKSIPFLKQALQFYVLNSQQKISFEAEIISLLPLSANIETIKEQYRKLALIYHPDVKQEQTFLSKEAENRFLLIKEAYEVLSQDEKKLKYDKFISNFEAVYEQSAKPPFDTEKASQYKDSMKEKMFEKIRSDLQKKADLQKQEKEQEARIKKVHEYEKYMQEQKLREEQRREVQDQWEKLKQIQKQQTQERNADQEKKDKIPIHQFRYDTSKEEEDYYRKLEEMYLQDYQSRQKQLKQQKQEKKEYLYSQFKKKEPKEDKPREENTQQMKEQISLTQEQIELLKLRQQNYQNKDTISQYQQQSTFMTSAIVVAVFAAFGFLFISQQNKQQPSLQFQAPNRNREIILIEANTQQQQQQEVNLNQKKEEEKEQNTKSKKQKKPKVIEPSQMKTQVLIPFLPAQNDPIWLLKKHAGKKLDPLEIEEYYQDKFQKENYYLVSGKHGYEGIPSSRTISSIVVQYHTIKKNCLMSQNLCSMRYNNQVFLGPYDECGKIDIFKAWHDNVKESRAKRLIDKFMDQYDLPMLVAVGHSKQAINAFFQAKYGMFTCYDSVHHIGAIDFDIELITYWERQPKQIKFIWYMANLYALAIGKLKWSDLEPYKKSFKHGENFRKYKTRNPNHEEQVNEIILDIKCADLFSRLEEEGIETQKQEIIENLKKKVQFYQNNQNYLIPQEIKQFLDVENEEELERLINEQADFIQQNEVKKMEKKKMTEKRLLPEHILNPSSNLHQNTSIK